jgi:hypothetical protein
VMVLLLTGAIDIRNFNVPSTTIVNINKRLSQYLQSIEYAICNYRTISEIVFCENTGYNFDYSDLQEKAFINGKKLEIISFLGNYSIIEQKGKGFGEGEIIKYALNNSKILLNCDAFFKLTGRLIVRNMDEIVETTHSANSFIYHPKTIYQIPVNHIETFLYKVSKDLYIKNLINAFERVEESKFLYLEHVFYEQLSKFDLYSFKLLPQVSGISGSSGKPYELETKELILQKINYLIGVHNLKKTIIEKVMTRLLSILLKFKRLLLK